jgi:hypothetical protein
VIANETGGDRDLSDRGIDDVHGGFISSTRWTDQARSSARSPRGLRANPVLIEVEPLVRIGEHVGGHAEAGGSEDLGERALAGPWPGLGRTLAGDVHYLLPKEAPIMLLALALVLGIAWLLGFTVFHVTAGAIHVLIVVAVVVAIVHFVQGRRAPL